MTGKDHPARALRLIKFLPEGSAFRAHLAAAPTTRKARPREAAGWENYYGWTTDSYILASIYTAVMASGGAKNPLYPALPGRNTRTGRPLIPGE